MREIRAVVARCLENGRDPKRLAHPDLEVYRDLADAPALYSGSFGMGSRDLQPEGLVAAVENMMPAGKQKKMFYLSIDFLRDKPISPSRRPISRPSRRPTRTSASSPSGAPRIPT